jgi:hypothetical protein
MLICKTFFNKIDEVILNYKILILILNVRDEVNERFFKALINLVSNPTLIIFLLVVYPEDESPDSDINLQKEKIIRIGNQVNLIVPFHVDCMNCWIESGLR